MVKRSFFLGGMFTLLLMVLGACGSNVSSSVMNQGKMQVPPTTPAAAAPTAQASAAATTAAAGTAAATAGTAAPTTQASAAAGTAAAGTAAPTAKAGTATATAKCNAPAMVSITNDANPTYSQKSVNLNMGDTLAVMNQTTDTFTLKTDPDYGLRYMVVDPNEIEYVPFPQAGTFTLASQEHPETVIVVVVATQKGSTCNMKPAATISFGADNVFSQTSASVNAGQSILLANQSQNDLNLTSTPNLGTLTLHPTEQQTVVLPKAGTYVISPQEFPDQKLTVTVK